MNNIVWAFVAVTTTISLLLLSVAAWMWAIQAVAQCR